MTPLAGPSHASHQLPTIFPPITSRPRFQGENSLQTTSRSFLGRTSIYDPSSESSDDNEPTFKAPPKRRRPAKKANPFIIEEVGVEGDNSSDEDEEVSTSLAAFVADDSIYLTSQDHVDIQARYVKSLLSPSARPQGHFKIPELPSIHNRSDIFSQVPNPDETADNWELDSFIVSNDEITEDTELDELELAEMKLEKRKRRAQQLKNGFKRRRVIRQDESSDEDEELKNLRMEVNSKELK